MDVDGVLTRTAELHAGAWKRTFDAFLSRRSKAGRTPAEAVHGRSLRKSRVVLALTAERGVAAHEGSLRFLQEAQAAGACDPVAVGCAEAVQ